MTAYQFGQAATAAMPSSDAIHDGRTLAQDTATTTYNDRVVRQFAIMTIVWGIVGMLVGAYIAALLIWPDLNFGLQWLSYGRIRPLHTNAVIFAFGGSAIFATSYYIVQRTCHVRVCSLVPLAEFTFWGWQLIILLAALTLPFGITTGKEYAELEWPIDLLIAVVWVAYADRVPRHAGQAQGRTHLRRQLVLRGVHHHRSGAAHRQQRGNTGDAVQVLLRLRRRCRRHGAVVVRTQCGGLLPHRRLPRHDVLLRAQAGRPPYLLISPVDRALLGADLHLHVGRPAPPALHDVAGLGTDVRHGVLA